MSTKIPPNLSPKLIPSTAKAIRNATRKTVVKFIRKTATTTASQQIIEMLSQTQSPPLFSANFYQNSTATVNCSANSTVDCAAAFESSFSQSKAWHAWLIPLLSLFAVLTTIGNCLVVFSIVYEKALRTSTNYCLISLAMADLLVGCVVMPLATSQEFFQDQWVIGSLTCNVYQACDVMASTCSILNLCLISHNRYMAISKPLIYNTSSRRKLYVAIGIGATWLVSILVSAPLLLGVNDVPLGSRREMICAINNGAYAIYLSVITFFAPSIAIAVQHIIILRALAERAKHIKFRVYTPRQSINGAIMEHGNVSAKNSLQNDYNSTDNGDLPKFHVRPRRCLANKFVQRHESLEEVSQEVSTATAAHASKQNSAASSIIGTALMLKPFERSAKEISMDQLTVCSNKSNKSNNNQKQSNSSPSDDDEASSCVSSAHSQVSSTTATSARAAGKLFVKSSQNKEQAAQIRKEKADKEPRRHTAFSRGGSLASTEENSLKVRRKSETKMTLVINLASPSPSFCHSSSFMRRQHQSEGSTTKLSNTNPNTPHERIGNRRSTLSSPISKSKFEFPTISAQIFGNKLNPKANESNSAINSAIINPSNGAIGPNGHYRRDSGHQSKHGPKRSSASNHGRNSSERNSLASSRLLREDRAIAMLFMITLGFFTCWLPYFVATIINGIWSHRGGGGSGDDEQLVPVIVIDALRWLGHVNSTMNPIFYGIFNKEFRIGVWRRLTCKRGATSQMSRAPSVASQMGGVGMGLLYSAASRLNNEPGVKC